MTVQGLGGVYLTPEERRKLQRTIAQQQARDGLSADPQEQAKFGIPDFMKDFGEESYTSLLTGVEGYSPLAGTLAQLPQDRIDLIEAQIGGQMDNTLKNLTLAHFQLFGTWPDFDLTADILDNGEVEFETLEEALAFFGSVKEGYSGTGRSWQLESSGASGIPGQEVPGWAGARQGAKDTWSPETDVLDPEMIASFRPKSVDDFLFGPYMKRSIKGKSNMFREGKIRLDEMLIQVPRQWAVSQLAESLGNSGRRNNPDLSADESLMRQLNQFLIERIPDKSIRPAPTAQWQDNTEKSLRFLQMMRASAIYIASGEGGEAKGEEAVAAAGFLQHQGFGDMLGTLDEQIRWMAQPSGNTPDEQRKALDQNAAAVEQMWIASRNPGITPRMALNQLHDLNPNATTQATQKQVGTDSMMSHFGMAFGWLGHVPGHEEVVKLWETDEFKAVRSIIPAVVGEIGDVLDAIPVQPGRVIGAGPSMSLKDSMVGGMELMTKYYEYRNLALVTIRQVNEGQREPQPVQVLSKLTWGLPGLVVEAFHGTADEVEMANKMARQQAFAQYLTIHNKAHPGDVESMGSFVDRWKFYWHNNQDASKAGIPMQYTDELMRDSGVNPLEHPEFSFLAGFAVDTALDLAMFKGAGVGFEAARATQLFRNASAKAASELNVWTVKKVMADAWRKSHVYEELSEAEARRGINLAAPRGMAVATSREEFAAKVQGIFGFYKEDVNALTHALETGKKLDGTAGTIEEILDDAIPQFVNTGKKTIFPDQWAIFERAKEKMLYDTTSALYREKHPFLSYFLEKTYPLQKVPITDDHAESTAQRLASQMRTTIGRTNGGFEKAVDDYLFKADMVNDSRSARILLDIKKNGDVTRLADFIAGRYLRATEDVSDAVRSRWEANHQLRLNGATSEAERVTIAAEKYVPDVKRLEGQVAATRKSLLRELDQINDDLDWTTPASKRYQKYMAKQKNRAAARIWFEQIDARGYTNRDGSPIRMIPRKAERLAWEEKQKLPEDRIDKGLTSQREQVVRSLEENQKIGVTRNPNALMAPKQGLEEGKKVKKETSKAWRYDQLEAMKEEEQRLVTQANKAREEAGLMTYDEIEAANAQLDQALQSHAFAKQMVREAHETTLQFDRRVSDVAHEFLEARDIENAKKDAKKFVEGRKFKDKKLEKEQLEILTRSYTENVRAQHARYRAIRNKAFDEIEEMHRMLPFEGPVEFGGRQTGIHEQFARGMPRAGRRSAESRRVRDLQADRQIERMRLETLLSGRRAPEANLTRTQLTEWVSKAEAEVDDMTRSLSERLEPFMNVDPEGGVIDTSRVAPEFQDTLAELLATTPGEELPVTNASEFFTKINSFGGAPDDVARQALADFDNIFGSTGLDDVALENLRFTLTDDLRMLDKAREHERKMKLIAARETHFQVQNAGRANYPQINIIPERGVMPTKTTEGRGLYTGPRWFRDGELVGDERLELPEVVRRHISSKMKRGGPEYGRQNAIDEMTEYLESVLLNRLTTVEHTARKKPWSFIQRSQDPEGVFYETHGRVPPGATEPLWNFEQRSSYFTEDWLIKGQTTTKESELDLSKPAADRPTYHRSLADQRIVDALNEIMDEIWDRHAAGGASEFHVFGRTSMSEKKAQEALHTWAGEPAGALQRRLPIVTGPSKGRYAEKLSDSGKRIVIDTKTDKAVAAKPLILDTGSKKSPLYCPFVVERKANQSAADAKKALASRYQSHLESQDPKNIESLLARSHTRGALIIEGDLKGTLHKFLVDFENGSASKRAAAAERERVVGTKRPNIVENGDIFDGSGIPVITTNLGGVHGAGIAKMAKDRGLVTQGQGSFAQSTPQAVLFPVKDHWRNPANLKLMKESFEKLGKLADAHTDMIFLLPPVGLGHGGRTVREVAPMLREFLSAHQNVHLVLPSSEAKAGMKVATTMKGKLPGVSGLKKAIEEPYTREIDELAAEGHYATDTYSSRESLKYRNVAKQIEHEAPIQGLWGEAVANFIKNNIGARVPNNLRTLESEELFAQRVARRVAERSTIPSKKPLNIWWGTKENAGLSNLAPRPFTYQGRQYQSVEHAYQSLKTGTLNEGIYGRSAWSRGGKIASGGRPSADADALMVDLIRESYKQNPDALRELLATGERALTHTQGGAWAEKFPRMLMQVRDGLRGAETPKAGGLRVVQTKATEGINLGRTTSGGEYPALGNPFRATGADTTKAVEQYAKYLDEGIAAGPGNPVYDQFDALAKRVAAGETTLRCPVKTAHSPCHVDVLVDRLKTRPVETRPGGIQEMLDRGPTRPTSMWDDLMPPEYTEALPEGGPKRLTWKRDDFGDLYPKYSRLVYHKGDWIHPEGEDAGHSQTELLARILDEDPVEVTFSSGNKVIIQRSQGGKLVTKDEVKRVVADLEASGLVDYETEIRIPGSIGLAAREDTYKLADLITSGSRGKIIRSYKASDYGKMRWQGTTRPGGIGKPPTSRVEAKALVDEQLTALGVHDPYEMLPGGEEIGIKNTYTTGIDEPVFLLKDGRVISPKRGLYIDEDILSRPDRTPVKDGFWKINGEEIDAETIVKIYGSETGQDLWVHRDFDKIPWKDDLLKAQAGDIQEGKDRIAAWRKETQVVDIAPRVPEDRHLGPGGAGKPPTSPQRMGEFGPPKRQPATPGGMQDRPVATPKDVEDFRNNTMTAERFNEIVGFGGDEAEMDLQIELAAVRQEIEQLERQGVNAARQEQLLNAELLIKERELANAKAMISEGHVRPVTPEAVDELRKQFEMLGDVKTRTALDVTASDEEVLQEISDMIDNAGKLLDKMEGDPEGFRSIFYPGRGIGLETEAAMEWQMNQWYFSRFNYSKLSKFVSGGPIKAVEAFNANKRALFFNRWSIDDATTLYKWIVMAKVSTMLRIPLADEATRFISEGMNPLTCWKRAKMLKELDSMPKDIQFRMSDLIRKVSDGPYDYIEYDAKGSFTHYQKWVTDSRQDATYSRFLLGKRLWEKGPSGQATMAEEIRTFLRSTNDHEDNLRIEIQNYLDSAVQHGARSDAASKALADELNFKAWLMLGYRRDGALRGVGSGTHRFVTAADDELGEIGDVTLQTKQNKLYRNEPESAVGGPAIEARGEMGGVKGDATGLVDSIYQMFNYYYTHPILGKHWRPSGEWKMLTPEGVDEWEVLLRQGKIPSDMMFGKVFHGLFDGNEAKKAWQSIGKLEEGKPFTTWDGNTITPTKAQVDEWRPILTGQRTFDGLRPSFIHSIRDALYGILDYSGAKMNEMVYANAFTENVDTLSKAATQSLGRKLTEDEIIDIEKRAHFTARSYMERVMFTNVTYGGEEFFRNLIMFLPAYRQFATYWAPYLAKHPFALSLVYRANRDKEHFKVQAGGFEFNLSRMSFLINQSDQTQHPSSVLTGWLPNGAPLLTVPVSTMAHFSRNDKDNVWGNLAGNWPFEFAGEFSALNSPIDKIFYGVTGKTLPWPFGTDDSKNAWRAIQIQNEAWRNHDKRLSGGEAMWRVRVNRLIEGGWNFFSPIGGRVVDEDIEGMMKGKIDYNKAQTPTEVEALLAKPEMSTFKTFLEWQNLPSYEQLDFISQHPKIVPFAVSGYSAGDNASGGVGMLWSKMKDNGVPDPDLYVKRVDAMYKRIDLVLQAADMRKRRDAETDWWYTYKSTHSGLHQIERMQNEWENSTGEFAPGGTFYIQGHHGIKEFQDLLNKKYVGIDDPYTGLTYTPGQPEGDGYRLAKFMDAMGGPTQKLLKMSPNYEMYVRAKYLEKQENVTGLLKEYMEGRVTTRLTKEQIRQAGYSDAEVVELDLVIKDIDKLWNTADAYADSAGGYTTSRGREIRKQAIDAQNAVIHSSPLTERFLGDNVTALYQGTYLTTPSWKRTDYVRLDKMDPEEREMFNHLTTEIDPETGEPRLDMSYMPEKEKRLMQSATVLSYVPMLSGSRLTWRAKVSVGGVVGTIPCKAPDEAATVKMSWQKTRAFLKDSFNNMEKTEESMKAWREQIKQASIPEWVTDLVEEDIRAESWSAWLAAAGEARRALRDTVNVEYGGASGYSTASKLGLQWKAWLIDYGNSLALLSPSFAAEWEKYNGDNVMTNSILDWYL